MQICGVLALLQDSPLGAVQKLNTALTSACVRVSAWNLGVVVVSDLDGPVICNANRGDLRESIRAKNPHFHNVRAIRVSCLKPCDSQVLVPPPRASKKKGVQFENPEAIRENQVNLRIDSRESGHVRFQRISERSLAGGKHGVVALELLLSLAHIDTADDFLKPALANPRHLSPSGLAQPLQNLSFLCLNVPVSEMAKGGGTKGGFEKE